ncbi:MAG TPA: LysR family transcriptional regulator [Chitinophagaceae bacterium]|jgi:DNA-binding transcriptional LysR family regulator|nr:LysR family transcriptional regulator [Chitinophagaceae bacterium]
MNYTLNQLQVFLKIAQTHSVTKAAEQLHLTQPAVSIQLKNFQDQFEIPLTEVVGRKIYITEFGREIAAAAENILNEVYAINYKTLAYKGQLTGRLKISVVSTGKYVMPYFLTGFIKQHPGVDLVMDVTNKEKVIENLERNEVDFSLVSIVPDTLSLNKVELIANKLYLVGSRDAGVPAATGVKKLFEQLPLIFRESGSGTRQTMERFIEKHDLHVRRKMELTSNEAVKQAVLAGLGYSIMPLIGIKNELRNGQIQIIPVKGLPIKTSWQLIWLRGKNLSPAAASFLEYINREKSAVIKKYFSQLDEPFEKNTK